LMESLGFTAMYFHKIHGISFPRRAAHFEYVSPVSPENLIDLKTEVKKVGVTSITLSHTFYKRRSEQGERILAANAEVTVVAYDDRLREKTELPSKLVDTLKALGIQKKD